MGLTQEELAEKVGISRAYMGYIEQGRYSASLETQNEGWVISSSEWDKLMSHHLPSVGLTQSESADAKDYLETIVPSSPYYLISIKLNSQKYPITISPRPDTFLHYQIIVKPIDKPISVSSPSKFSPKREGFTAVMWEEKIIH